MLAVVLLALAIFSAVCFPRAKGGTRLFFCLVMLASIGGFLLNIVHFTHPGL